MQIGYVPWVLLEGGTNEEMRRNGAVGSWGHYCVYTCFGSPVNLQMKRNKGWLENKDLRVAAATIASS